MSKAAETTGEFFPISQLEEWGSHFRISEGPLKDIRVKHGSVLWVRWPNGAVTGPHTLLANPVDFAGQRTRYIEGVMVPNAAGSRSFEPLIIGCRVRITLPNAGDESVWKQMAQPLRRIPVSDRRKFSWQVGERELDNGTEILLMRGGVCVRETVLLHLTNFHAAHPTSSRSVNEGTPFIHTHDWRIGRFEDSCREDVVLSEGDKLVVL